MHERLAIIGLLFGVTQFGGIYGGFALGVPAGLSALVMLGLAPLVTTGLAIAGGQESHDRRMWGGLVIGIAGVAIGLTPELGHAQIGAGLILTAVGMLGLAGGSVLQKRWGRGVDPIVSAATQSVTGAVVLVPAVTEIASVPALGEPLHPATLAGMAVSWAGVWVAIRSGKRPAARAARWPALRYRASSRPHTPA
jgi:drug/metabolite transporter (DMT)-like permease